MSDPAWELARLQKIKDIIDAFDDAILALTVTGVQSYEINTTQSTQRVTRQDLNQLVISRARLFQQYDSLCARLTNGGAIQVIPGALP